jgi:hydroxyethylthiazole kinase
MDTLNQRAADNLAAIRSSRPLVHNITNFVVMNYTANALLAMGASPVMAHSQDEVQEMSALSSALVLNIGTLSRDWVDAMISAGKAANAKKIPVVFDPVGSGATLFRTLSSKRIIGEVSLSVIRGNASEILSLARTGAGATKGVDSTQSVNDAAKTATVLAGELDTTLAITGPVDLVTGGDRIIEVHNGHPMMVYVTGAGCAATAVIGAFCAIDEDPVSAAATALAFFGLAGEIAAKNADAPGSFMIELINALYRITPEMLQQGCRFNRR